MADLVLLVPSRGRPRSVERLVRMCALTCMADTRLHFGFDEDDECLEANRRAAGGHPYEVGPRRGLAAWTNILASLNLYSPALGSFGDDHVPVTRGWDSQLLAAMPPGGGITYPDDERRVDIPEGCVMSTRIVVALGWMCYPNLEHWYVDQVWADLGRGANCLVFCPHVIVRHLHPNVSPGVRSDATYTDAARDWDADLRAYQRWRLYAMRKDIATVARVRETAPDPF